MIGRQSLLVLALCGAACSEELLPNSPRDAAAAGGSASEGTTSTATTTGSGGGDLDHGAAGRAGGTNAETPPQPISCAEPAAEWIAPEERWPTCVHPEVVADCDDGWCKIPAGCFIMGSPEHEWGRALYQEDQVAVTLTRSFEIGQYEVTQREWGSRDLTNPSGRIPDGRGDCLEPDCPVGNVTWFEAVAYANLLSEEHGLEPCYALHDCINEPGQPGDWGMVCSSVTAAAPTIYECEGYRLPTDAEWEYAARAGTRTAFYSGPITCYEDPLSFACRPDPALERIAWYCYNAGGATHAVGQLEANTWGLYDMSGNAFEWVNDRSDGLGARAPVDPDGIVERYISRNRRGGSLFSDSVICRNANQLSATWDYRTPGLGFRLARTLPPP